LDEIERKEKKKRKKANLIVFEELLSGLDHPYARSLSIKVKLGTHLEEGSPQRKDGIELEARRGFVRFARRQEVHLDGNVLEQSSAILPKRPITLIRLIN